MNNNETLAIPAAESVGVPADTREEVARERVISPLAAAHVVHPFLPIEPVPSRVRAVIALLANHVETVALPGDQTYVYFLAPAWVPFYVNFRANIVFPLTAAAAFDDYADPLVSPIGIRFFCKGARAVTIGIPDAGAVVSVAMV